MGIGSGLGASLGFAPESTFGVYVAPTRFKQFNKQDLKKKKNTVQGGGLAAGQLVQSGVQRVVTTEAVEGSFDVEVSQIKMGLLLQALMGTTVTPVQQASSPAYLQTHALADTFGKSLTIQAGLPTRDGTVRAQTFKGCKITSAEFSCKVDELLTATFEVDGQKYSEVETLAAVTEISPLPFHWGQFSLLMGTFGSEASVSGVKGVTCKIERGMDTEGFYGGSAGLKAEPVLNDWAKISGSIDVDFVNKADFSDRFHADSSTSMILRWQSSTAIASSFFPTFEIDIPMTFFDGDTFGADGPDVITGSIPFVGQFDLTHAAATILYMSTDTTV